MPTSTPSKGEKSFAQTSFAPALADQRLALIARKLEIQQQFSQIRTQLKQTLPYKQYTRILSRREQLSQELSGIELQLNAIKAQHRRPGTTACPPNKSPAILAWLLKHIGRYTPCNA